MTVTIDPARIDAHVASLREEIAALRAEVDAVAALQAQAALERLLSALAPAVRALVRLEGGLAGLEPVGAELASALRAVGLARVGRAGAVLELWPEQAGAELELDREVPADAGLVRVEVLAPGYALDELVVARPVGRVIEVVP